MRTAGAFIVAGLCLTAASAPAHADLRIAFGNDLFTDPVPPIDDSGFTNDVAIAFWRPHGAYLVGGALLDRWITEVGGRRRWDQVDLVATVERPWRSRVVIGARLGPTFGGNFGGRWAQDGWHRLTGSGASLDEGLQDRYPGGRRVGVIAGGNARATIGTSRLLAHAGLDAQLALGQTGVTWLEAAAGGQAIGAVRCVELGAHVELAVARYHVADANLALPGGYGTGSWEPAWRVGVHVAWRRIRIEYEYRANEGGSGEPLGVVAVTITQAGTSAVTGTSSSR